MAKKNPAAKTAAATEETNVTDTAQTDTAQTDTAQTDTAPAATETKVPLAKMRGPKGVKESAVIKLLVPANPKRPGSKASTVFACYADGMTVGAFCDKVDAAVHSDGSSMKGAATPNLVYDSAHGFISIEGYEPPNGVVTPKPKAPPKPKTEKVKGEKPAKVAAEPSAAAAEMASHAEAVKAATTEEVMD
jgi:hypothetical protein